MLVDPRGGVDLGSARASTGRGAEQVDVRVPNRKLTEEELKEYNLRSNKNTGEWDFDILTTQFQENMLKDVGFDLSTFPEIEVPHMEGEDDVDLQQLIAGFSTVVGYRPFCKYLLLCLKEGERNPLPSLPTYEWDKLNPASRYEELIGKPTTQGLVRL